MKSSQVIEATNSGFQLTVQQDDRLVYIRLLDLLQDFEIANGAYSYEARSPHQTGSILSEWLVNPQITKDADKIIIRGQIAGLELEHEFWLPSDQNFLEERISLRNASDGAIIISDFASGLRRPITNGVGTILPELEADRFIAIPYRHRPDHPGDLDMDFAANELLKVVGTIPVVNKFAPYRHGHGYLPSLKRHSEGWAWCRDTYALGIFKFNQNLFEFSVLGVNAESTGAQLQFAGGNILRDESIPDIVVQPGETLAFGETRLITLEGGYTQASYAFRAFLDERGCKFPANYDPPVHWNEIYDNPEYVLGTPGHPPEPRLTRQITYTRELMLKEAAKAKAYHCEALYLDPGWDTDFATFLWDDQRLGTASEFVQHLSDEYGLKLALHCPLAPWMSLDGRGISTWPEESYRTDKDGKIIHQDGWDGRDVLSACLGSHQYLDEAERRLLDLCSNGTAFLMFDGNWWQSECWNPDHGHPVPYTKEAHCRANLDLAQRIHAKYPDVLIEMHDMMTGGNRMRFTPVYYKFGLPGSYDENWGHELMWQPMEDILTGRARALYYYNLACNIPIYLHIDLRLDNLHALVFWWYASTCRHLGIGGTHHNPLVAAVHRDAMRQYRQFDRFYKRGNFYGLSEEIHIHSLPDEASFVINLFNLSDQSRAISGAVDVDMLGLPRDQWYVKPYGHEEGGFNREDGTFRFRYRMEPWSAQLIHVYPLTAFEG